MLCTHQSYRTVTVRPVSESPSWPTSKGGVVVTKDRDFRDGYLLAGSPERLLVVATGNITNMALLSLFETRLRGIVAALEEADFVEPGPEFLVVHQRRGDDQTH